MNLKDYDSKHVRIIDKWGNQFTGLADYYHAEYGLHVFNREEESIRIWDNHSSGPDAKNYYIFASDIQSIEELTVHGTTELATDRLTIREYLPEDAPYLYRDFGTDEVMYRYTGWNPYATLEMAKESVQKYINSYKDTHFYGWAIEFEGILVGTIGAYDYDPEANSIEVGISITRTFWGHGFATEALKAVLEYLTENEGIALVTAWCAKDNIGSTIALERAGMVPVRTEPGGLEVDGEKYDKVYYEYRRD